MLEFSQHFPTPKPVAMNRHMSLSHSTPKLSPAPTPPIASAVGGGSAPLQHRQSPIRKGYSLAHDSGECSSTNNDDHSAVFCWAISSTQHRLQHWFSCAINCPLGSHLSCQSQPPSIPPSHLSHTSLVSWPAPKRKMKTFVCIAALAASASAGSLSVDMAKNAPSPFEGATTRAHARDLQSRGKTGSIHIGPIGPRYVIKMTIGQPPQEVGLTVDTGSTDMFVLADSAPLCSGDTIGCVTPCMYLDNQPLNYPLTICVRFLQCQYDG